MDLILMYHRGGPVPCYRPAFAFRRSQDRYEFKADNAVLLDGTTPKRGEAVFCGSCGEPVHPQWVFDSPVCEVVYG